MEKTMQVNAPDSLLAARGVENEIEEVRAELSEMRMEMTDRCARDVRGASVSSDGLNTVKPRLATPERTVVPSAWAVEKLRLLSRVPGNRTDSFDRALKLWCQHYTETEMRRNDYFRPDRVRSGVDEHNGTSYVVLRNNWNNTPAVYRIRKGDGRLISLRDWPASFDLNLD